MKPHQLLARVALLDLDIPDALKTNKEVIFFAENIAKENDRFLGAIEEASQSSYKEGETLGFENGKQNMLDDMADWFEDIDTAAEEFIESVNAELSESPHSVQIAIDKFKESLAEFSKRMEGKS